MGSYRAHPNGIMGTPWQWGAPMGSYGAHPNGILGTPWQWGTPMGSYRTHPSGIMGENGGGPIGGGAMGWGGNRRSLWDPMAPIPMG